MFNNNYGLEDAVLSGKKTSTCRKVNIPAQFRGQIVAGFYKYSNKDGRWYTELYDKETVSIDGSSLPLPYRENEIVAIAQSYSNVLSQYKLAERNPIKDRINLLPLNAPGFRNKMFVDAELMPHHIEMLNVHLNKIQELDVGEFIKEGIFDVLINCEYKLFGFSNYKSPNLVELYKTTREAFAALIDKTCGAGTWKENPLMWRYEFQLYD